MFKYFNVLLVINILIIASCIKEKSILDSDSGSGKLTIKTDQIIYLWQQSEKNKLIVIQGELQNNSTKIYYSKVGDSWGGAELLLFAINSAGRLEKLNTSDNKWYESELLGMLIEGPKFIPVEPSKNYAINATLYADCNKEETGKFRLRIDYYNSADKAEETAPFCDYSNIFEIRAE